MKCQACNGKVSLLVSSSILDTKGVCDCGAIYVANKREVLARTWCTCPQTSIRESQEVFYFSDNGNHGWLHTVCGQITQTG